ncbi:ABC transporter permease [Winogradskyella echinorum]|uniref:Transport permease protein n=1 Tax=Winogradskyella echinorum TaxID=538189 RepID=A0ABR6Y2J6_9FLAO|nr:ABC transporter permease [Winogradskyella echinorum]MBC3846953.1 ABC transporter permease [Winogradskyella echinorum]MBC5751301.1 ABC transporter permease [Winogradskyella echinorum]
MKTAEEHWLYTISSKKKLIDFNFKEIWRYRDLLFLFVKRDIITLYKQTVLGPLWYLIQPLFTSLIFTLIFNNLADIPTGEGVPNFLFNLAGITSWNYFKECLVGTSDTFKKNENIFGKVYFPRVIMPMSVVVSNLLKFGIQLLVLAILYIYYVWFAEPSYNIAPQLNILLFPFLVFLMALLGLGLGMIISSMTTKYRDLSFLVQFGVQLLMYGSAVMYPMAYFQKKLPDYYWLIEWNPIAIIVESFRTMAFGVGSLDVNKLVYTTIISVIVFLIGLVIFNKTEKSFIDTI